MTLYALKINGLSNPIGYLLEPPVPSCQKTKTISPTGEGFSCVSCELLERR